MSDVPANKIRRIAPDGLVTTWAGTGALRVSCTGAFFGASAVAGGGAGGSSKKTSSMRLLRAGGGSSGQLRTQSAMAPWSTTLATRAHGPKLDLGGVTAAQA